MFSTPHTFTLTFKLQELLNYKALANKIVNSRLWRSKNIQKENRFPKEFEFWIPSDIYFLIYLLIYLFVHPFMLHLTTLPVGEIRQRRVTGWQRIINCEVCGKQYSWSNLRHSPTFACRNRGKIQKTSVRIASLPAKTWNRDLTDTKQECWTFNHDKHFHLI